jgi:hypothetical protein
MGLANEIKHYIHQRGRVTLGELNSIADKKGYKRSTMERRMREACEGKNATFGAITNAKGYVVGYEVKKEQDKAVNSSKLPWQEQLKQDRERNRIFEMTNKDGKIIACS